MYLLNCGGTERIVAYLTDALVDQGHDVTLFASGDSRTKAQLVPVCHSALRLDHTVVDQFAHHIVELQKVQNQLAAFDRRPGEGPTAYPVACSPQAWSVAAVFLLLQSLLNLEIDALTRRITFRSPALPDYLEHIRIERL